MGVRLCVKKIKFERQEWENLATLKLDVVMFGRNPLNFVTVGKRILSTRNDVTV